MSEAKPPIRKNQKAKVDPRTAGQAIAFDEEENRSFQSFLIFNAMPSWLASFLLNLSMILILALLAFKSEQKRSVSLEASESTTVAIEDSFNMENVEESFDNAESLESEMTEAPSETFDEQSEPLSVDTDFLTESSTLFAGDTNSFDGDQFAELSPSELSSEIGGRGDSKQQLLRKFGGNAASEAAVELALQWIADHQMADGGWSLDHTIGPTVNNRPRTSPNPGELTDARRGATALALLPFLGNGQTHRNGKHKQVVLKGLRYLMNRPDFRGKGIVYMDNDGEMYSHGLVSIVFAECYAMTGDEKLREFVEGTLRFIEDCQNPIHGGWRYEFQERGDTSVVGWQIMALKSGKLSGVNVKAKTFKLAKKFLDSVSTDYGAYYGYQVKPIKTESGKFHQAYLARTAVGLLCRMYMGWEKEREGIETGVQWFSEVGPDTDAAEAVNMYYNYYATQVMKHYGGEKWRQWNVAMRDFLVNTQVKDGVAKGSWHFNPDGQYQAPGGRLYTTSLACLTLEVYYRYLPLYQEAATDDDFILD